MKNHVAAALLGVCLTAGGASASDEVASMSSRSSVGESVSAHQHSPAFLGFMSKHDKKYCDGDHVCEVSIIREQIWKLNQEFVNAHNSNPGAYSADRRLRRSKRPHRSRLQHPSRSASNPKPTR